MSAFDDAWSLLKALPEQQMLHPSPKGDVTMHPVIQGMLARRGMDPRDLRRFHLARRGIYPEGHEGGASTLPKNFRATDVSFGRQAERERRAKGDIDPNQLSRGSVFADSVEGY